MPYRRTPFVPDEIYHVFNRSIARQTIFRRQEDYKRIIDVINYYRFDKLPLRFSHYKRLPIEQKELFTEKYMLKGNTALKILAYCIMPNHFHFLIKPTTKNGVSDFMRNIQNSYSKFFNLKYERTGSLFQSMFKAVRIETDEQLLHVSRYIHLNPATSYIVSRDMLGDYPWSSLRDYILGENHNMFVDGLEVLGHFKSRDKYREFVFDNLNYQRELENIKHLLLE